MKRVLLTIAVLLFLGGTVKAQSAPTITVQSTPSGGTTHGIYLGWFAGSQGSDTNAVAGYNVFRCPGTCTLSSTWTQLNTSPVTGLQYVDLATDTSLTNGSTFSFAVTTVDTIGNQSPFSNIVPATVPSTGFPQNPSAPSTLATAVH